MAVDMALSLRDHTEYPIALAADDFIIDLAKNKYRSVFDHMTLLPLRFRNILAQRLLAVDQDHQLPVAFRCDINVRRVNA